MFTVKGRTSRGAFIAIMFPIISIWLGIASWFTTTNIDKNLDLYNTLINARLGMGAFTFAIIFTLVIRRLNDGADKASFNLRDIAVLLVGLPIVLLHRLFIAYDMGHNQYGPPQQFPPDDPRKIG